MIGRLHVTRGTIASVGAHIWMAGIPSHPHAFWITLGLCWAIDWWSRKNREGFVAELADWTDWLNSRSIQAFHVQRARLYLCDMLAMCCSCVGQPYFGGVRLEYLGSTRSAGPGLYKLKPTLFANTRAGGAARKALPSKSPLYKLALRQCTSHASKVKKTKKTSPILVILFSRRHRREIFTQKNKRV